MYSDRIEKAIRTAGRLHASDHRKGVAPLPYLTHLFSVALITRRYSDDEDVFVAALLHDTLEDTDYTPEELEQDFGKPVRNFVLGVTEPKDEVSWEARKRGYVEGLEHAPIESLLISAADKIHNMLSVIEEYTDNEELFWKDFSGSRESRILFYEHIVEVIKRRLENHVVGELEKAFAAYKDFLKH